MPFLILLFLPSLKIVSTGGDLYEAKVNRESVLIQASFVSCQPILVLIVHSHVCFRLVNMVVKAAIEVNPRAAGKSDSEMQQTTVGGNRSFRKQMETLSKAEEKSILVAKELKFVKSLAGNDVKLRRKVMKNLKIWLTTRSRSTFGKHSGFVILGAM